MPCQHCCGANQQFDTKSAKKDLKHYLKRGPRKPTKRLTEAFKKLNTYNLSLLDIGGGVGPIPLELIPQGLSKVTDVDASEAYIEVAKAEAQNRGYQDKINYHLGDFIEVHTAIEAHDIVTLDKVICCYPYVEDLLKASLPKAKTYYALVYPQDNFLVRLVVWGLNLTLKIRGNPFRTFIHDQKVIDRLIANAGFTEIYSGTTFLSWQIHLYKKG
ncbi:MAG: class I SAM-dependent methyltransferase [Flavobacteriaceae bacterium]|nr:class I SAM-dependent methyltransferase [Flavobacteriaceae bacterium]